MRRKLDEKEMEHWSVGGVDCSTFKPLINTTERKGDKPSTPIGERLWAEFQDRADSNTLSLTSVSIPKSASSEVLRGRVQVSDGEREAGEDAGQGLFHSYLGAARAGGMHIPSGEAVLHVTCCVCNPSHGVLVGSLQAAGTCTHRVSLCAENQQEPPGFHRK
eukprot:3936279-Rhodomonas_salina.2